MNSLYTSLHDTYSSLTKNSLISCAFHLGRLKLYDLAQFRLSIGHKDNGSVLSQLVDIVCGWIQNIYRSQNTGLPCHWTKSHILHSPILTNSQLLQMLSCLQKLFAEMSRIKSFIAYVLRHFLYNMYNAYAQHFSTVKPKYSQPKTESIVI